MENGFEIIAESIMTENGKYYEIMVAEAGHMSLSDKEVRFGPHLMKDQSQVFQLKWQREINKLEIALDRLCNNLKTIFHQPDTEIIFTIIWL